MNLSSSIFLGQFAVLCLLIAACGGTEVTSTGTGGAGGGGSGGAGGKGPCTDTTGCTNGEFCGGSDDGACGTLTRKCEVYPASCGEGPKYTACGCDGKTHVTSACPSAVYLQVDMRPNACAPAAGMINCGEGACATAAQFCNEGDTEVKCADLPAECMGAMATCACLKTAGIAECSCVDEPSGGVRVTSCGPT